MSPISLGGMLFGVMPGSGKAVVDFANSGEVSVASRRSMVNESRAPELDFVPKSLGSAMLLVEELVH